MESASRLATDDTGLGNDEIEWHIERVTLDVRQLLASIRQSDQHWAVPDDALAPEGE